MTRALPPASRTLERAALAAADAERWAEEAPWLARLREADARVLLRLAEAEEDARRANGEALAA